MTRFMLDTNTVGHLMRKNLRVSARLVDTPARSVCLSVVTEAEIRFGLAQHGGAASVAAATALLETLDVLPWTRAAAVEYGALRAKLESQGRPLAPLDMMIAAHALERGAVLVSSNRALLATPGLASEDWLA